MGDYKKLLDKILKIFETQSELIHMSTCYKLLLILGLILICHFAQWGWPLSETIFREDFLAANTTC